MERPGTAYLRPLSRCCLAGSLPSSSRHRPLSCAGETVALRRRSSPAASRCRADSPPTGGEGGGGLPVCRDDAAHSRAEHTTRIPTREPIAVAKMATDNIRVAQRCESREVSGESNSISPVLEFDSSVERRYVHLNIALSKIFFL